MVIGSHFSGFHAGVVPNWIGPLGSTAVSWFFILSGFILAYNYPALPNRSAQTRFIVSRFWRLFPVQAVTIGLSLALFPSIRMTPVYTYFQSLTLTHGWAANPSTMQAFNVPAWSISDEWFFYLMFPLLIARGWVFRISIAVLSILVAYGWAAQHGCWDSQAAFQASADSLHPTCHSIVLYWPIACLAEFILGIAICSASMVMREKKSAAWIQVILATITALAFWQQDRIGAIIPYEFFSHFFETSLLDIALGTVLILALSLRGIIDRMLSFAPMIFVGEISFSMYMTHMLVMQFLSDHQIGYGLPIWLQFLGVSGLTIVISSALFLAIERPSRLLLKAAFRHFSVPPQAPAKGNGLPSEY
jgi:peptidoglycan/LPS O-acetylase OafA/YrhL